MSKQFKDIVKFTLVFSTMGAGFYASYKYFQKSTISKEIQINDEYIFHNCKQYDAIQTCYRKNIARALENAHPSDLPIVLNYLRELQENDLRTTNDHEKIAKYNLLYKENVFIFFDYIKNYSISRNTLNFLDIFEYPYFIDLTTKEVINIISNFQEETFQFSEDQYRERNNLINNKVVAFKESVK